MTRWFSRINDHAITVGALTLLVLAMGGTWLCVPRAGASPLDMATATAPVAPPRVAKPQGGAPAVAAVAAAGTRGGRGAKLVGRIDINSATAEELERLPTIGPAKAARIVAWRQKNGGFRRTADLRRVKGIAYKTFKILEPYVEVAAPKPRAVAPVTPGPPGAPPNS